MSVLCCIRTVAWNISDMKKEVKDLKVQNGSKEQTGEKNPDGG